MSIFKEYNYQWYEKFAMNVIKVGPIPGHIAFISDGNRRYARNRGMQFYESHVISFEKILDIFEWCFHIGVKEVTIFAFSIENFKRPQIEIEQLMKLSLVKLQGMLDNVEHYVERGIRIRLLGNMSVLSPDLQKVMSKLMLITERNTNYTLNLGVGYSSHEDITNSIQTIIEGGDELETDDITEDLIDKCLYTRDSPDPDLLIRTSGETRISHFLMWQLSTTILLFLKALWPSLTFWSFIYVLLYYQLSIIKLAIFKNKHNAYKPMEMLPERIQKFLRHVDEKRRLLNLASEYLKDEPHSEWIPTIKKYYNF